jgi:hypothetical protein
VPASSRLAGSGTGLGPTSTTVAVPDIGSKSPNGKPPVPPQLIWSPPHSADIANGESVPAKLWVPEILKSMVGFHWIGQSEGLVSPRVVEVGWRRAVWRRRASGDRSIFVECCGIRIS